MIACVVVRDFAPAIERRHHPRWQDTPLVVVGTNVRPRVLAMDSLAHAQGVTLGVTAHQAQGLCPSAQIVLAREDIYRREHQDWLDSLRDYANKLEADYSPTTCAVYLTAFEALDEVLALTQQRFASSVGVGVATDKFTARAAAALSAHTGKLVTVKQGTSAQFLAKFPAMWLPLDKEMQRRLPLLGLSTIGQIARLPRGAMWEQFGKHGRWVHELACGRDPRPIQHQAPHPEIRMCHAFEDGVADQQLLQSVLLRLTDQAVRQLDQREAQRVCVQMTQEDGSVREVHVRMPLTSVAVFARQCESVFAKLGITHAIMRIELRLLELQQRPPRQLSLFDERPHDNLEAILPKWIVRYPTIGFYTPHLADNRVEALPKNRFLLEKWVAG